MANWIFSADGARELVELGRKLSGKSIQRRSRPLPTEVDDDLVALFKLTSNFTLSGSEYVATAKKLYEGGNLASYAETIHAHSKPTYVVGNKVHAAFVNNRWELIAASSKLTEVTAGAGITVTPNGATPPTSYQVANSGVTSLNISGDETFKTGAISLDKRYFEFGGESSPRLLTVKKDVLRGRFIVSASQTNDTVTLTFGIIDVE